MRRPRSALMPALVALAIGCVPADPSESDTPVDPGLDPVIEVPTFECDPAAAPVSAPLRRLSRQQYLNTVHALADHFDQSGLSGEIRRAVAAPLATVPADAGSHQRLDQVVGDPHVAAWYATAEAFGEALAAEPWTLEVALGSCATDRDVGNDRPCVEDFVREFGGLAARRPMAEVEVGFFMDEVYGPERALNPDRLRDVIAVMLSGPAVVYHLEDGGNPVDGREDLEKVSAYELANRLSYHFWQGPPDGPLRAAAADGSLLTDAGFEAALDRVASDPRTEASIEALFDGWLHLDAELPALQANADDPRFVAFAGEDLPAPGLRDRVLEDAYGLIHYEVARGGSLDDLMTTTAVTTRHDDVAALYDSYPWDGISAPDEAPERVGLLARPALVASGTHTTQPIHKGVRIRRDLLCGTVGNPPADLGELPTVDDLASRRTQTEQLTERPGTSCVQCHRGMNPLGYATENFDGLGRFRASEAIFGDDGTVLATHAVDTTAEFRVSANDGRPGTGVGELAERIVASGKHHACLARVAVRHATSRLEDELADGCWLESVRGDLAAGKPLSEALREVASRPEFRLKAL